MAATVNLTLTIGYSAFIYWISSIPGEIDPENPLVSGVIVWTPPAIQNLAHIPVFALLTLLWYSTLKALQGSRQHLPFYAFLLATSYGVFDEWHQLHVPGRYASLTDIMLNMTGAAIAAWLITRYQRDLAVD